MDTATIHKEVCKGLKLLSRLHAIKRRQWESPDDRTLQAEFDEALTAFNDFACDFGGFSESEYNAFRRAFSNVKTSLEFATDPGLQSDIETSHASFHELAANRILLIHEMMNWDTCKPSGDSDPSLSNNELLTRLKQEMAFVEPAFKADDGDFKRNLIRKNENVIRNNGCHPEGQEAFNTFALGWDKQELEVLDAMINRYAKTPEYFSEASVFKGATGKGSSKPGGCPICC
ncbi:hypothetical protein N8639_00235 [bacterium]|nr:hypothetical protein [bacterium]